MPKYTDPETGRTYFVDNLDLAQEQDRVHRLKCGIPRRTVSKARLAAMPTYAPMPSIPLVSLEESIDLTLQEFHDLEDKRKWDMIRGVLAAQRKEQAANPVLYEYEHSGIQGTRFYTQAGVRTKKGNAMLNQYPLHKT